MHSLRDLREQIIRAACAAGEGHIPSALSILDILWVLYREILSYDPNQPSDPERDRFVLSKGHASLGIYAILAERGFFPIEELKTFGTFRGRFGGHPDSLKVPGIEASTGSLGHGMPMAVGMALGLKSASLVPVWYALWAMANAMKERCGRRHCWQHITNLIILHALWTSIDLEIAH